MIFTPSTSTYKTYSQGDPEFRFSSDGITLVPRAAIQIDNRCPGHWKTIIAEAYEKGWLTVIAHQPVQEHFMEELAK